MQRARESARAAGIATGKARWTRRSDQKDLMKQIEPVGRSRFPLAGNAVASRGWIATSGQNRPSVGHLMDRLGRGNFRPRISRGPDHADAAALATRLGRGLGLRFGGAWSAAAATAAVRTVRPGMFPGGRNDSCSPTAAKGRVDQQLKGQQDGYQGAQSRPRGVPTHSRSARASSQPRRRTARAEASPRD
jgi:hypothetical protein